MIGADLVIHDAGVFYLHVAGDKDVVELGAREWVGTEVDVRIH